MCSYSLTLKAACALYLSHKVFGVMPTWSDVLRCLTGFQKSSFTEIIKVFYEIASKIKSLEYGLQMEHYFLEEKHKVASYLPEFIELNAEI